MSDGFEILLPEGVKAFVIIFVKHHKSKFFLTQTKREVIRQKIRITSFVFSLVSQLYSSSAEGKSINLFDSVTASEILLQVPAVSGI